jgi:metal-sulfur cluster biosynthetic enzyme
MPTKSQIITILKKIPDPELNISVWDLGLIYDVKIGKKGDVVVVMTLTSPGCPLFSLMEKPIKTKVKKLQGVKSVVINLTFSPPWNADKMTKKGKKQLGFF